ncbi:MAG: M28 family peptidase [Alphaproteobacteria bacterium]|nr:M28 family peptidase [Alphaproteobacteria bacterium]MBU1524909.1 M28 family peptidase [Alphaproteobacteria bacterium]MBU2116785.1 M28 family peptidase [Alphaproteobacteria bacterium]MBU2352084.1 M28 family peptidase [Alphaproteobacteria bacterium]MBU2381909.1 M28 family peptidase [Alphaproteobacteria bacterium]
MRLALAACLSALLLAAGAAPVLAQSPERGERWVGRMAALSDDAMEGRRVGTPGYDRAAAWVVGEMEALGLKPGGVDGGWYQPIRFLEQTVHLGASSAELTVGGATRALTLPADAVVGGGRTLPATIDAELIFVGYGLHIPSEDYSDLDGVDLTGKIAVFINGAPTGLPSLTLTHARAQRTAGLMSRGAVGTISLVPPQADPTGTWAGVTRGAARPGFFPDTGERPFAEIVLHPDHGAGLFAGAPKSLDQIVADARAGAPQTSFPLDARLSGRFVATSTTVVSPNVIGVLPGSDPELADEYVVMTSHLDGYGIGEPVNGDAIYNGALDNASGVAAQLDIAEQLIAAKPRRSILFVIVTAEERGLLGSRAFVANPTVPRESIVGNLNYDMALPIIPLTGVNVLGATESTFGVHAAAVSAEMGLPLTPDPFPAENRFIRSDQYSFIAAGIPAVAFKFGFAAGTPEATTIRTFNETHYHKPTDDMTTTPILVEDEIRLHDFITALALRIANADDRPTWNADSIFGK